MIIDTTCSVMERKIKEADLIVPRRFKELDMALDGLPTFKLDNFPIATTSVTVSNNAPIVFDIGTLVAPESVDLIIFDPPYGIGNKPLSHEEKKWHKTSEDWDVMYTSKKGEATDWQSALQDSDRQANHQTWIKFSYSFNCNHID